MNISSFLAREVFRPLATLITPGAAALAPYVILLYHYIPSVASFLKGDTALAGIVLVMATIAAGLILEDVGSRIEAERWDEQLKATDPRHLEIWDEYLKLVYPSDAEPLGQHYIRTVLLRMKFELSFGVASLFAIPGIVLLAAPARLLSGVAAAAVAVSLAFLGAFLLFESYSSAQVLARTRRLLVGEPPEAAGSDRK